SQTEETFQYFEIKFEKKQKMLKFIEEMEKEENKDFEIICIQKASWHLIIFGTIEAFRYLERIDKNGSISLFKNENSKELILVQPNFQRKEKFEISKLKKFLEKCSSFLEKLVLKNFDFSSN